MPYPDIQPFDKTRPLAEVLKIVLLPLVARKKPFQQLEYIRQYVEDLRCSAILIESDYIDRDYMQDHSVFYSTSFAQYPPVCRRIHFFKDVSAADLPRECAAIASEAEKAGDSFQSACDKFSETRYLGFTVIKPLPGSPVGRTVLKTFPEVEENRDFNRQFEATRPYTTHLLGLRLTVRGLAFQQQDEGVSACATTAVWSSLQKLRDFEDVAAATPAQITAGASRFALPFGRSMPSEGLSLDQMCQAIHGLGVAPNLVRVTSFATARSILHVAGLSGIAPILVIQRPKTLSRHAITAAGIKLRRNHADPKEGTVLDDLSKDLMGLYIHDDRVGPYVRTRLEEHEVKLSDDAGNAKVPFVVIERRDRDEEEWLLTHLLMPVHGKIRTSVVQLVQFSAAFGTFAHAALSALGAKRAPVSISTRIARGHIYIEGFLTDSFGESNERRTRFFTSIRMSRYVGVTRMEVPTIGVYDVLVDTTGTARNAHCLGIICRSESNDKSNEFGVAFGRRFACPSVI
jgi:hypothetical protein